MLGGHEGDRGRPWVRAVCPGLPACVAARRPTSFRTMVAVRLSQQEQPHHCTARARLMTAAISAACSFARGTRPSARTRRGRSSPGGPVGAGAVCNLDRICYFCLQGDAAAAAGSRWPVSCWRPTCSRLIEAHACVGGRPRAHPARATQNAAIGTRRQRNRRTRGRVPRPGGRDPGHQAHDRRAARAGLPVGDGKENRRPGVRCRGLLDVAAGNAEISLPGVAATSGPGFGAAYRRDIPARADRQLRPRAAASPSCRPLVGAEHRTAPAARADRLDSALAQLLDGGGMLHGDRVSYR